MRTFISALIGILAVNAVTFADPKVDQESLDPDGNAVGCSVAAGLQHIAVLMQKGSKYNLVMDGVAGPKIESMCWTGGAPFNGGYVAQIPVLFSDDGGHYAYCYKDGADMVIILDGKETGRMPMQGAGLLMPLTFSIGGKHLAWGIDNTIYMDGKPGPKSRYMPQLNFSPDGTHYAYQGTEVGGNANWAFVDGRQVNYFGEINQYTKTNHLLSIYRDDPNHVSVFVMDGKPEFKAANIDKIWTSSDGKQIAISMRPDQNGKSVLSVNGTIVPGSEGTNVQNVFFSPDGKRYAAHCSDPAGQFMIIDGKKQDVYPSIPEQVRGSNVSELEWVDPSIEPSGGKTLPSVPAFTPDSSKFIYTASAANQTFLMTEDGEYDDYTGGLSGVQPVLAGGHYGFIGQTKNGKQAVVIDGKATVLGQVGIAGKSVQFLTFSPDGSRWACVVGQQLYVDGKAMPGNVGGQRFCFSPDSKHVVYDNWQSRITMDGKVIETEAVSHGASSYPVFSPDSNHFYWVAPESLPTTKDNQELYCDGKAVAHFTDPGLTSKFSHTITKDGVLSFVAKVDGTLTKITVTPDSNLDAVLATAKEATNPN